MDIRIGTAGWSIPPQHADLYPAEGSHLERYAALFDTVEINSSFYRPHRRTTYVRWAETVPETFRFSVKFPRTITHEHKLADTDELIAAFLDGVTGLGQKLGPLLIQLPPRLVFDHHRVAHFMDTLRAQFDGALACEPRHPSWASDAAEDLLRDYQVARVDADPAVIPAINRTSSNAPLHYIRLHGAPEIYVSAYDDAFIAALANRIEKLDAPVWCIFDNTARGAASDDGRRLRAALTARIQK